MTVTELVITSGQGPAEARRFVVLLAARLERLAAQRGLAVHEVITHPRSIVLRVHGDASLLADQLGTHALIHRSAARGRAARKRWFAAVAAHVPAPDDARVDVATLSREDLVITACRAGGPGGQHVNKVATAVRVEHVPSGLCVRCASSRSQQANLEHALRRLATLLRERAEARHAADAAARRALHYRVERGRPVHTYQLDADDALVEGARR